MSPHHPTQTDLKSPNLEVVSNNHAEKDRKNERRRLPRLHLAGEQFRLHPQGKVFSVSDLSNEGMALTLLDRDDFKFFPVATHIQGTLNLHGEKHPIQAVVRHLGHDVVGCQFENLDANVLKAIAHFMDPKTLGTELRPIPSPESGALLYRGPSGTHLLLWRGTDGQYRKMSIFLLGSFIQWDTDLGLSTGKFKSTEEHTEFRGIFRIETLLLDADASPDPGKLEIAKTLLMSSNLPQDLKKWCVRHLEV